MKKLALVAAISLALALLAGCGSNPKKGDDFREPESHAVAPAPVRVVYLPTYVRIDESLTKPAAIAPGKKPSECFDVASARRLELEGANGRFEGIRSIEGTPVGERPE